MTEPAPLDQRLSILTLAVRDLDEARDFYNTAFGWTPIEVSADEAASIAFYQLNGFQLALYPLESFAKEHEGSVGGPAGFTLAYNVNSVEEVDAVFARMHAHGATVLNALHDG